MKFKEKKTVEQENCGKVKAHVQTSKTTLAVGFVADVYARTVTIIVAYAESYTPSCVSWTCYGAPAAAV